MLFIVERRYFCNMRWPNERGAAVTEVGVEAWRSWLALAVRPARVRDFFGEDVEEVMSITEARWHGRNLGVDLRAHGVVKNRRRRHIDYRKSFHRCGAASI